MSNSPYTKKKLLGICVLVCMYSVFVSSCTQSLISIISLEMKPVVAVHYRAGIEPYMSEGMSVLASVDVESDTEYYQVGITSPDNQFAWEQMVQPFTESEQQYVGIPHLALPPDFTLPQGEWKVELVGDDGGRVEETFIYQKSLESISLAQLAVAFLPELSWEESGKQWKLTGVPPKEDGIWTYQFFNPEGLIIHTTDSQKIQQDPLITNGTLRERTHMIVGAHYNEQLGVYLMIRQVIREFDQPTATTADE